MSIVTETSFSNVCEPILEFVFAKWVVKNKKKIRKDLYRLGWSRATITAYIAEYEKKIKKRTCNTPKPNGNTIKPMKHDPKNPKDFSI